MDTYIHIYTHIHTYTHISKSLFMRILDLARDPAFGPPDTCAHSTCLFLFLARGSVYTASVDSLYPTLFPSSSFRISIVREGGVRNLF